MAYPGDLSNPVARSSGAAKAARLTPDDFEQLAAAFKPSWELDDAPFTGTGTMAPGDLRALQSGGGTHADVRVAAHSGLAPTPAAPAPMARVPGLVAPAAVAPVPVVPAPAPVLPATGNGAQPAPGATRAHDAGQKSGETVITAADIAAAGPLPPPAAPTPLGPPVIVRPPPSADRLAKTRIAPRAPPAVPAPKESTGSFDLGRSPFRRRSKGPLWIGAGVGAVALAAAGIWAMGNSETKAPPPPPPVLVRTVEPPTIPPPPPETTPTVVAPPPKAMPAAAPPPAPPPVQAAPPPVVVQRPVVAPPAPPPARPVYVAPVAPRPAPRPKGGNSTIVHDLPF